MRSALALLLVAGIAFAQTPLELEAFQRTNEARVAQGLPALAWDDVAYAAARKHALDMLRRGFFDHVNPDGRGPADRMWAEGVLEVMVGENLALYEGYTPDHAARVVVGDWLDSPPHRRNLLKPEFTHLGLALVQEGDRIAVVQNFIARPFEVWVWRTPSRKRVGLLRFEGGSSATVGIFVGNAFREALQPPTWSGSLEVEPGSRIGLGLWRGDRYLLACAFTLPDVACASPRLVWRAQYSERVVESVRLQLSLPPQEYWLAYGREPQPLEAVSGSTVVDAPRSWGLVWVGIPREGRIEYTHRIPLLARYTERVRKGDGP